MADTSGAIQDFEKAIEVASQDPSGYANLANIFLLKKEYNQSIDYYSKAIEVAPEDPSYPYYRGIVKIESRDREGACEDWKKSAELGSGEAGQAMSQYCQ